MNDSLSPTAAPPAPRVPSYLERARKQLARYEALHDKAAVRLASLTLADPRELGDKLDPFMKSAIADHNALGAQVEFWRDMVEHYAKKPLPRPALNQPMADNVLAVVGI